jgi:hypothetical protein
MPEVRESWVEMENILVEARDEWRLKRQDYQDAFEELGAKGQFSDIWRKIAKLKRAVWEGEQLKFEQPEQIAKEIIPHLLIMIYLLRREPLQSDSPTAMEVFSEQPTQVIKP